MWNDSKDTEEEESTINNIIVVLSLFASVFTYFWSYLLLFLLIFALAYSDFVYTFCCYYCCSRGSKVSDERCMWWDYSNDVEEEESTVYNIIINLSLLASVLIYIYSYLLLFLLISALAYSNLACTCFCYLLLLKKWVIFWWRMYVMELFYYCIKALIERH